MKIELPDRIEYKNDKGQLHRLDGPAIEYFDGHKEWWVNGSRHRLGGPAIEYGDGSKEWCVNDKRHREDGPAIEWVNDYKEYHLNDVYYTEEEFHKELIKLKLKRLVNENRTSR